MCRNSGGVTISTGDYWFSSLKPIQRTKWTWHRLILYNRLYRVVVDKFVDCILTGYTFRSKSTPYLTMSVYICRRGTCKSHFLICSVILGNTRGETNLFFSDSFLESYFHWFIFVYSGYGPITKYRWNRSGGLTDLWSVSESVPVVGHLPVRPAQSDWLQ